MEQGFPVLTDSFLNGQDIFYGQFNDIEFYVEDTDQENLYFNVLKKLFPDLKFEKIFPLNGKTNVISTAQQTSNDNKKVYIVDLDFDEILNQKENINNLFYLNCYSIENSLLSKEAVYEIIKQHNPKLKDADITNQFNYNYILKSAAECLQKLIEAFVVIRKFELGIQYYNINTSRDFDFNIPSPHFRMNFISDYLESVEQSLKHIDRRFTLLSKSKEFRSYFNKLVNFLLNAPGKYILRIIKDRLYQMNLIYNMSLESFTYLLSKEFQGEELDYLKSEISSFIE
ncbi:DUF4435 domain-containing protein [Chondrinema litorale]|uniref:DUF4435 domain-containing protein n=1 Tax=Chondrinema litorale TaxID=2994555 RepID=UPI002543739E|nr:DUF4435 domain-containing protein [Chondrinema litorale]UZR95310.1 DUF4435 domain-containing protein [Chondrinema litorale]